MPDTYRAFAFQSTIIWLVIPRLIFILCNVIALSIWDFSTLKRAWEIPFIKGETVKCYLLNMARQHCKVVWWISPDTYGIENLYQCLICTFCVEVSMWNDYVTAVDVALGVGVIGQSRAGTRQQLQPRKTCLLPFSRISSSSLYSSVLLIISILPRNLDNTH